MYLNSSSVSSPLKVLFRSPQRFIANFAKLLTCIILLNFYEKSMEFNHVMSCSSHTCQGQMEKSVHASQSEDVPDTSLQSRVHGADELKDLRK